MVLWIKQLCSSSILSSCQAAGFSMQAGMSTLVQQRIGFLGAGMMAEALMRGFIDRGVSTPSKICVTDPVASRKDWFNNLGAKAFDTAAEVADNVDVLFVSVRPQHVSAVLREARPFLTPEKTVVSIAAGITIEKLLEAAGPEAHVVRVMPNLPCLVGEAASAMCLGGGANDRDEAMVRTLFESVGRIYTLSEPLLAAATGLSGSGPAYIFMIIEALADGGVQAGLPRDVAQALAAQTVLGSARMVLAGGKHPAALKDLVASPGGTTIAGIHELEKAAVRGALMSAVAAGTARAQEMAQSS